MPKLRSHPSTPEKNRRIVVRISVRDIEKKIRKPHAPPTKIHVSKKTYRRKPKHPKKDNEA
ncbi:hypothetical protein KKF59_03230 [Patescibacteria group bacterium]|nr:hypothetical protein [Patescibacteria group bacterium]MBU1034230.1 hypothetical protein [Patescibacteria group bacterium]MBU1630103.1 hypothetical protein [Patescibacteria group bacterium]MBU1908119.1 hypothetical protein [Patescibacteria group bacterium]